MRKIDKGAPMPSFTEFVSQHHPAKWADAKDVSHLWREYILVIEQYRLSGYTEEPVRLVFIFRNGLWESSHNPFYDKYIVMGSKVRGMSDNQRIVTLLPTATSHNNSHRPSSLSQSRR
ncbi:MAG: hypothetical protein IJR26_10330, partial [Bacteroidales bacterium]|nr:hypothetical protein [Bacteroidales bacterium]